MSFDSSNDSSNIANFEYSDRSNGSSRTKSKEDAASPSTLGRDRKGSYTHRDRDRSHSRSASPSRLYARMDRKVSSRQGKRERLSRDDRSISPPFRSSRENRRYHGRDRKKSKERKRRDKRSRTRSRSRNRSPKRSKKSKRRVSSGSSSPNMMSTSLIDEIKKTHGAEVASKSKKKKSKKRRRHSSSSSTSSEEMNVDGPASSNGMNIPKPMPPPPSMLYQNPMQPMFSQIVFHPPPVPPPLPQYTAPPTIHYGHPGAPTDMFSVCPPPQPPPFPPPPPDSAMMMQYGMAPASSSSRDNLVPPPPLPTVAPPSQVNMCVKATSKMMEGLPLPPNSESKRIKSRPVVLNRRGIRRRMDVDRPEWRTSTLLDYQMLDQIGEGTYGQVYKAVNKKTGEQVALKRVRLENEKEGFPITAIREIKILRELNHKNIVKLHDIVMDNVSIHELRKNTKVNFYLVFEYVDHDLMGLLDSKELIEFSKEQICLLFKQLLEGLAYCHQAGFLHRDIKCSNILVNNRGELKIADLGLARLWHKDIERLYTNRVITLWYRPPELLLGDECYGPSIDIWSAGCMLGELFTRKPLFNGHTEFVQLDIISKVCGSPTPDLWPDIVKLKHWNTFKQKRLYPRRVREEYEHLMPPHAVDLLDKLLCLDPTKRLTAKEALLHPWIRSLDNVHVPPLKLPKHQDCHEMWSKKQKRISRSSKRPGSPGGSGSGSRGNSNSRDFPGHTRHPPSGVPVPSNAMRGSVQNGSPKHGVYMGVKDF